MLRWEVAYSCNAGSAAIVAGGSEPRSGGVVGSAELRIVHVDPDDTTLSSAGFGNTGPARQKIVAAPGASQSGNLGFERQRTLVVVGRPCSSVPKKVHDAAPSVGLCASAAPGLQGASSDTGNE